MSKFYFEIKSVNMELNTENEAEDMCCKIEELLHEIGASDATVSYGTDEVD